MEKSTHSGTSLGRALAELANLAIDQAHDLAVARLDGWTNSLHDRVAVTSASSALSGSPAVRPSVIVPLVVGVLAGAAVAWWLADGPEGA